MSTNLDLITESMRLLGVLHEVETPSADQGSHALGRLNRMMESWTERDIEFGWFEQTSTSASAPIPKWSERGVISKLAQDLLATYPSAMLAPWVLDDQQNGFAVIQRKCMVEKMRPADMRHMPQGEGRFRTRVSILNDD